MTHFPPDGGGPIRRGRRAPLSEINVTPLVDVMLVLLIIFMISAPLLTVGVPLELPKTEAGAMQDQTEPLTVSVRANGEIFLNDTQVAICLVAGPARHGRPRLFQADLRSRRRSGGLRDRRPGHGQPVSIRLYQH